MRLGSSIRHGEKILWTLHRNTALGLTMKTLKNQLSGRADDRTAEIGASLKRIGVMQAFHEITIKSI
jgi:hypothetical protein